MRILFRSLILFISLLLILVPATYAVPKGEKIAEIGSERYDIFKLENGLKVLLIRGEDTQISGAAISISGGRMSTPEQLQGLPHLLEHIVFLGSNTYPGTSNWHEFINQHVGWSNGSTLSDLTRFQFQLKNDGLKEGLIRLNAMLFHPSINARTIKIGLSEVDKEFTSKKENDWQGILSVLRAATNPKHPGSKFGIGNTQSLQASSSQLKAALKNYQAQYYVPRNMTLAVYTHSELPEMRQFIENVFGQQNSFSSPLAAKRSNNISTVNDIPQTALTPPLFNKESLGSLIAVQTRSPSHTLDLRFELPPAIDHPTHALYQLIAELIGHETKGSIIARLRNLGLATELNTVFQGDGQNEVLDIYIRLTNSGLRSLDEVIGVVFSYINLLSTHELPLYVQEERIQILTRSQSLIGTQDVGDWLGELSKDMLRMPTTNWLQYKYETFKFSHSTISAALKAWLQPRAMQAVLSSPSVTGKHKTPYFNTRYSLHKFNHSQMKNWQASQHDDSLGFPTPNPYLSPETGERVIDSVMQLGDLESQIHLIDIKNSLEAKVIVNLSAKNLTLSAKTATPYYLTLKFILMSRIEMALGDQQYFASLAGYSVRTEFTQDGVRLIFSGRREGIAKYITDVIQAAVKTQVTQVEFDAITDHALNRLISYFNANNFNQASFDSELKVRGYECTATEIIEKLKKVKLDQASRLMFTTQIIDNVRTKGFLKIFYAGDLAYFKTNASFKDWVQTKTESPKNKPQSTSPEIDIETYPNFPSIYVLATQNVVSWRIATVSQELDELAAILVDRELWETKFKTFMRQDKKIAYHAGIRVSRSIHRPSLDFIIESSEHQTGRTLTEVYRNFFQKSVASLTDEELDIAKQQAIQRLKLKSNTPEGALELMQSSLYFLASDNLSEYLTQLENKINADNLEAIQHRQACRLSMINHKNLPAKQVDCYVSITKQDDASSKHVNYL